MTYSESMPKLPSMSCKFPSTYNSSQQLLTCDRLGGGDQIYNDGIRVGGPLREWTDISNPHKRKEYPFTESLRKRCDEYYVNNYIKW